MIIDAHGHYTTVPPGMRIFRALQISNMGRPSKGAVNISDDEIRASLEKGQIRLLDERGIDVMLFSPMASAMGHHFGNALRQPPLDRSQQRADPPRLHAVSGSLRRRVRAAAVARRQPEGVRRGAGALRQGVRVRRLQPESRIRPAATGPTRRSATSGGIRSTRSSRSSTSPAMMHASATCNPAFHTTGSHYLNVDSTAFMQLHGVARLQGLSRG